MVTGFDQFRAESIKSLMDMNSSSATAEAIAICLGSLKNKEGKLIGRVNLSEDFAENMNFCHQIAKMLRGEE